MSVTDLITASITLAFVCIAFALMFQRTTLKKVLAAFAIGLFAAAISSFLLRDLAATLTALVPGMWALFKTTLHFLLEVAGLLLAVAAVLFIAFHLIRAVCGNESTASASPKRIRNSGQ